LRHHRTREVVLAFSLSPMIFAYFIPAFGFRAWVSLRKMAGVARSTAHVVSLGLGFLLIGLQLARHFGRFQGGNSPGETNGVKP
jgi:hypothetical protein